MKVIPRRSIYRLSVYLRCLDRLRENNITTVSSEALSKAAGVKPTQLRKDLTYFGQFGTRGLGYPVNELSEKIIDALGTNHLQPVILIGVGNLGSALLAYKGFEKAGFEIVAAIDTDPKRKRSKEMPFPIGDLADLESTIQSKKVKMAILTVPATSAQVVANRLCAIGITAILNFAPIILQTPEFVIVNNVNLAIELENLSYFAR